MSEARTLNQLTIVLPVPEPATGGNNRGHWATVYRARESAKDDARIVTSSEIIENLERPIILPWSPVDIIIDWYGHNRPDRDNISSRCKAYVDGIVASGLIPDDSPDHVRSIQVRHVEIDRGDKRVEITVTEINTP